MSLRREATLNDVVVALAPITKREAFQSPKYSPIVGTITTSALSASAVFGLYAVAEASSLWDWRSNSRAAATRKAASGSTSPNSPALPSPSRSGLTCAR